MKIAFSFFTCFGSMSILAFTLHAQATPIDVAIAQPGVIQNSISAAGKISIHPDHVAYIVPTVCGIVKEIKKNQGERVEKNEMLALIESQEIAEAKVAFFSARSEWELAKLLLKKEEALRGIAAGYDYLHAQREHEEAHLHYELAKQNLCALGYGESEIREISAENVRFYEIRSPIKGRIVEKHLTVGERIQSPERVYTIADFEKVLLEIQISQNDLKHIQEGQRITISSCSGKSAEATIARICPLISEETRKGTAVAEIENNQRQWAPGEFVTATIHTTSIEVGIRVPIEAIQNIDGKEHVFVKQENSFIPQLVVVGKRDEKNVEILSGLESGQMFATQETFILKAEYKQQEEAEE